MSVPPYSAEKEDLFSPAKHAIFFPHGRPKSDAALCVELARLAYTRQDGGFAFDQGRVRKVLGQIQFTGCEFFESINHPSGRGSHGLLAIDENARLAVLSFRGTDADDITDIVDDLDAFPEDWRGGGKVHEGFAGALLEVWDKAELALGNLANYKIFFTGHSLGAAMATLAASLRKPDALYTFGSPQAGDPAFVSALESQQLQNFRYVDCCDAVAKLPSEGLGYAHIGRPYYIDLARAVQQRDPNDPYIAADQTRAEVEYIEKYAWRSGDVLLRPLADHAPVNYVWPVTAASP